MKEEHLQKKIRLVSFKARKFTFNVRDTGGRDKGSEPIFELKLRDLTFTDRVTWFAKVFDIKLLVPFPHEEIEIDVEYHTVFDCSEPITNEVLKSQFATVSAPAIGFPYLRAFITTVTAQAGVPPIIIPSINFVQFLKDTQGASIQEP